MEIKRQEDREEKLWREAFYQELDAVKRQQMLKEREEVRLKLRTVPSRTKSVLGSAVLLFARLERILQKVL